MPRNNFFGGGFYKPGTLNYKFEKPEGLGEMDWYKPEKMISRDDLNAIIFYMDGRKPETQNALVLKEMELQFKTAQEDLIGTTETHLEDLDYTTTVNKGITIFTVSDCPIAEIRISEKQFNFVINPDFWQFYN